MDYLKRTKAVDEKYAKYRKEHGGSCDFCEIGTLNSINNIVKEHKHFWIIKNAFPYSVWDNEPVVDHLLIVPKKHVINVSDLTKNQRNSLMKIINKYDKLDYSFMERCANNKEKSMPHQHTHLIKVR